MTGDHSAHRATPESRQLRLVSLATIVPVALAAIAALVWLWPTGEARSGGAYAAPEVTGRVMALEPVECPPGMPGQNYTCAAATVQLDDSDKVVDAEVTNGSGTPQIDTGDRVVVVENQLPDGITYAVVDHERKSGLVILGIAFAVALIAFGRWKGVTALIGLALTFAVLLPFMVPAILDGKPPLLVAIVGSAAIMLTVLYLTHGFSSATTVALLGTLASFILTGALSWVAVELLHLTGVTDDISMAVGLTQQVDMRGLLLAGIVIGSLGVLDDVTVTQSVTVGELARANPANTTRQLYRAGSRVGRSHIASVVNTIVLAYAGASLPLLILTVANNGSMGDVVTTQFMSQEIVRSAVATFGLIAAVPITTGLAAVALRRPRRGGRAAEPQPAAE